VQQTPGLGKVELEHAFAAAAINLIRLDAWWDPHPAQPDPDHPPEQAHLALAA
jgi:hypothetical protein